jgi:hypothetical protein
VTHIFGGKKIIIIKYRKFKKGLKRKRRKEDDQIVLGSRKTEEIPSVP